MFKCTSCGELSISQEIRCKKCNAWNSYISIEQPNINSHNNNIDEIENDEDDYLLD